MGALYTDGKMLTAPAVIEVLILQVIYVRATMPSGGEGSSRFYGFKKESRMKATAEVKTALFILSICALLLFWIIPANVEKGPARLMPNLSAAWVALFALWLLIAGLKGGTRQEKEEEAALIDKKDLGAGESFIAVLLFLVWGVYIFSLPLFGFYLGGFLALVASMRTLGKKFGKFLLAWSLGAPVGIYLLFEIVLQLRLPKGKLIETIFSLFVVS
jgi:hypothetical protein